MKCHNMRGQKNFILEKNWRIDKEKRYGGIFTNKY